MGERVDAANGEVRLGADLIGADGAAGTVVLVASFGRTPADFTPIHGSDLADRLVAAGHRVLLPWPRGTGGRPDDPALAATTLADLAADVAALIDVDGHAPVALVGHAFGQRVARMLATRRPDLVERLVLLAAGGGSATPAAAGRAIQLLSGTAPASRSDRLGALSTALFAPGNDPSPWLDGWDPAVAAAQAHAVRVGDPAEWWAGGSAPLYVVQPADDAAAPAASTSERLRAEFPDRVEVVTIAGAGHALLPERPARVAEAVLAFLAR